ncbi:uncharacterized protein V6R79_007851 [Siganus canaliculatus]
MKTLLHRQHTAAAAQRTLHHHKQRNGFRPASEIFPHIIWANTDWFRKKEEADHHTDTRAGRYHQVRDTRLSSPALLPASEPNNTGLNREGEGASAGERCLFKARPPTSELPSDNVTSAEIYESNVLVFEEVKYSPSVKKHRRERSRAEEAKPIQPLLPFPSVRCPCPCVVVSLYSSSSSRSSSKSQQRAGGTCFSDRTPAHDTAGSREGLSRRRHRDEVTRTP